MANGMFRLEALEAYEAGEGKEGAPLRLNPNWVRRAYWFVVAAAAVGIAFAVVVPIWDYAQGRAIIQADGRVDVVTSTGGSATTVAVTIGEHVDAGQRMIEFYTGAETIELERATREFELKLVGVLQDPSDEAARRGLAPLRAQRELAAARIRERTVFAPRAGVVTNVRVRPGQSTVAGEVVATLVDDAGTASHSVVAFVPGQFRPMIQKGMSMRMSLDGYPHLYTDVMVDAVGDETVGPSEVRRYLGPEVADTMPVTGPLLVVRGHLPEQTFVFDHQKYLYHDGLPGQVEVRIRSMRLIMVLLPHLREVFGNAS